MCGLVGATGPGQAPLLADGLSLIRHRGPDGDGVFASEAASLAHCRLAVIDPEHGKQPFEDESGRFVLVYNGEIYNYRELSRELAGKGWRFRTATDTEVLLAWLVEYGISGLERLNGMFAFALWDRRERRLLLARDRLGIKPLFWMQAKEQIVFASEIKGLLPWLGDVKPDYRAVLQFLTFQQLLGENSLFKRVNRLEAGSWLQWTEGRLKQGRFWNFQPRPNVGTTGEMFRDTLFEAVERQLVSDVPVGCYLSSGIDSSLVATVASRVGDKPLHGFTGAFADAPYYDERPGSRAVALASDMPLDEVLIGEADFVGNLERVNWHLEEPTVGTGALPQFMVAAQAAKRVKVVLTGHGGDELFAGYPVNKAFMFRHLLKRAPQALPGFLARLRLSEMARIGYFLLYPLLVPEVGYGLFVMTTRKARAKVLQPGLLDAAQDYEPLDDMREMTRGLDPSDALMKVYVRIYLQNLLVQEDHMGMAHGIEARMPLCDNAMLDLSLALPLADKLKGGDLKSIPRSAARSLLPPEIFGMPKRGFPTPYARWFKSGLARERIEDLLFSPTTRQRGIFRQDFLKKLFDVNAVSQGDGLADYARANRLYSYAMVEQWFRLFVDGQGRRRFAGA